MNKKIFLIIAIVFLTFIPRSSFAVYGGIRGGITKYKPEYKGEAVPRNIQVESKQSLFVGTYGGTYLTSLLSLDGGLGIGERKWSTSLGTDTETVSYRMIFFDGVVRVGLPIIGVGIGPYFGVALPTVDVNVNGTTRPSRSMASEGLKYADYGGLASARIRISPGKFGITADLRYLYGLCNMAKSAGTSVKTREIQALVGFDFGE